VGRRLDIEVPNALGGQRGDPVTTVEVGGAPLNRSTARLAAVQVATFMRPVAPHYTTSIGCAHGKMHLINVPEPECHRESPPRLCEDDVNAMAVLDGRFVRTHPFSAEASKGIEMLPELGMALSGI
jgi:hypothetical protein